MQGRYSTAVYNKRTRGVRSPMITVKRGAVGGEFYFVRESGAIFAFFYKLSTPTIGQEIWAVSGRYKPLIANVMDFESYEDALAYIEAHAPSRMKIPPD